MPSGYAIDKDAVEFRQETVTAIDPEARRVTTDAGTYDADFLVIAMGADDDAPAAPGFQEGGVAYDSGEGAARMLEAMEALDGGKFLISVLGFPFRCPPAPFEG